MAVVNTTSRQIPYLHLHVHILYMPEKRHRQVTKNNNVRAAMGMHFSKDTIPFDYIICYHAVHTQSH